MTKTLTALATIATITAASLTVPTSAEAYCRGCGVAAGIFGGLAVGALIGSAAASQYGYYPGPYYVAPAYAPGCYLQRQRVWDGYGWRVARVRICR